MTSFNRFSDNIPFDLLKPYINHKQCNVLYHKPTSILSNYYASDDSIASDPHFTYYPNDHSKGHQKDVFLVSFNGSQELKNLPELLIAINNSDTDNCFNLFKNFMHIPFKKLDLIFQSSDLNYKLESQFLYIPKNSVWLFEII